MDLFVPFTGVRDPVLPDGEYLAVNPLDKGETSNKSLWDLWDALNQQVAKFSVMPACDQSMMTKDLMEGALLALDTSFAVVHPRIVTRANTLFSRTYGTGYKFRYEPYPVKWTGNNRQALQVVLAFVQSLFQVPQVQCNRIDEGVVDNHAAIILMPLFHMKATLMKEWFAVEVRGDIGVDELQALFRDSSLVPPLHSSLFDRRDLPVDAAAEDAAALTDQTGPTPTLDAMLQVLTGKDVWTWSPGEAQWSRFGEILRRLESAGPVQVPPEPFPLTTGPIGSGTSPPGNPGGSLVV